jgi:lipopolysaccharide transport system ATP-binding protein
MSTKQLTSGEVPDPITIRARNVGKCYNIYREPKDRLKELITLGRRQYHRKFWALRGISLDVKKGQTVGIVGRNGSGKSTLLQIIAGTLTPTVGTVEVPDRISALLELGSGFNPEFNGRENVFLNAGILGLSQSQIRERYDTIVDFADIGDFMDQPVKSYSSGMKMRLAFAVAINVDPEVLVIDEALAVGDEIFQRKCFARIRELRDNGVTILFVSHSAGAIVDLCDHAHLIDAGEAILSGPPKTVIAKYHQLLFAPKEKYLRLRQEIKESGAAAMSEAPAEKTPSASSKTDPPDTHTQPSPKIAVDTEPSQPSGKPSEAPPTAYYDKNLVPKSTVAYLTRGASIRNPHIITPEGKTVNHLIRGDTYIYTYTVNFSEHAFSVRMGMLIKTVRGIELGGAVTSTTEDAVPFVEAGTRLCVQFPFRCLLMPGSYFVNAGVEALVDGTRTFLDRQIDAAVFKVQPERGIRCTGTVDFMIEPEIIDITNKSEHEESMRGL